MAAALRVLRNHWKKTVFFSGAAVIGGRYAKRKYEESEILRDYCLQAVQFGNDTLKSTERPRKIVVFLNPAAKKSTARRQFEKNVLPLLNLAGLEVHVVKTEHEGQAKAFMSVLDENIVDAVVVAGGDGTVSEIVTGLLRRNDNFVDRTPVGVIPVGTTNTLARLLLPTEENSAHFDVKLQCEAGMAIIRNVTAPVDVMEIKGKSDKPPVYAVSHLKWGLYTETQKEVSRYWYFGPLKNWYAHITKAWQCWPRPLLPSANVTVSPPCDGCSRCVAVAKAVPGGSSGEANDATGSNKPGDQQQQQQKQPWWRRLIGSGVSPRGSPRVTTGDPRASRVNPDCGSERALDVRTFELTVLSSNHRINRRLTTRGGTGRSNDDKRQLELVYTTASLTKSDFVKFRKQHGGGDSSRDGGSNADEALSFSAACPTTRVEAGHVTIVPSALSQGDESASSWFTIDSEAYEAMPTSIRMVKNALSFFCASPSSGGGVGVAKPQAIG